MVHYSDVLVQLHAIVEYDTEEAAEKAVSSKYLLDMIALSILFWGFNIKVIWQVASFNNEQDWRNGMHVKRLKRVVSHCV